MRIAKLHWWLLNCRYLPWNWWQDGAIFGRR